MTPEVGRIYFRKNIQDVFVIKVLKKLGTGFQVEILEGFNKGDISFWGVGAYDYYRAATELEEQLF